MLTIRDGEPRLSETARDWSNGTLTVLDDMKRHPEAFGGSEVIFDVETGNVLVWFDREAEAFRRSKKCWRSTLGSHRVTWPDGLR